MLNGLFDKILSVLESLPNVTLGGSPLLLVSPPSGFYEGFYNLLHFEPRLYFSCLTRYSGQPVSSFPTNPAGRPGETIVPVYTGTTVSDVDVVTILIVPDNKVRAK